MVDIYTVLALTSALAVIIPGVVLLTLLRGLKVPKLRNLTIILASFAILHGCYHLSYLVGLASIAPYIDLVTALILVLLGMYYSDKIIATSLFLITLPQVASDIVPIALIIAFALFVRLAIISKSLSSLQAQLSIFLIIWIFAELLRALLVIGILAATEQLQLLGLEIHTASMVAFGGFILFRYYRITSSATPANISLEWHSKPKEDPKDDDGVA
ncbi:MAG: hypothetical protein ACREBS_12210 [Nitrososphaerales archaeon]